MLASTGRHAADVREAMLLVLKRGLEANHQHSAVLWPLYLHEYVRQPGNAATASLCVFGSRLAPYECC